MTKNYEKPIIVELSGLPYAGKTTLIGKIESALHKEKISCGCIQEYNGPSDFYEKAKMGTDVTHHRLLNCLKMIIQFSSSSRVRVILIDRGIIDALAWIKWFSARGDDCSKLDDIVQHATRIVEDYSSKYYVAWMEIDPMLSATRHGTPGRIVNIPNLIRLKDCYKAVMADHPKYATVISLSSELGSSVAAKMVLAKAKLVSAKQ